MMLLTKLNSDVENIFETNVYDYHYLLSEYKVGHFLSAKDLKNGKEIAQSKARICKNSEKFKSHFNPNYNTEMYMIEKINLIDIENNNKGIMTIIMCDILLSILDREFAWGKNIEVLLTDRSKVLIDDEINSSVSVYSRIFRGYKKGIDTSEDRLVVEGVDMYYLFPQETRKDDIRYYEELRSEKYETFKNSVIKKQ